MITVDRAYRLRFEHGLSPYGKNAKYQTKELEILCRDIDDAINKLVDLDRKLMEMQVHEIDARTSRPKTT